MEKAILDTLCWITIGHLLSPMVHRLEVNLPHHLERLVTHTAKSAIIG